MPGRRAARRIGKRGAESSSSRVRMPKGDSLSKYCQPLHEHKLDHRITGRLDSACMTTRISRLERVLLSLLIACTVASLAGYATFGLHPRLIGSSAGVARTYALA